MGVVDLWYEGKGKSRVPKKDCGKGQRWMVRWYDGGDRQRKLRFETEDAAQAYWADLKRTPQQRAARATVGDLWPKWIGSKAGRKPATLTGYRAKWRLYVKPRWSSVLLGNLRYSDAAEWLAGVAVAHSSTTARQSWTVFHGIVQQAVRDKMLSADPCAGMRLPPPPQGEVVPIDPDDALRLVEAAGARNGLAVEAMVSTAIRWGEMAGLDVRDLDLVRHRLRIRQNASLEGNTPVLVLPKSGRRWVSVSADLAARLAGLGGAPDDPLFRTRTGGRWRYSSWWRMWNKAVADAGLSETTHVLRHTAVSMAIAEGADIKQVQKMVGHSSGSLTIDRYTHLFKQHGLDDVAQRISGRLRNQGAQDVPRPERDA